MHCFLALRDTPRCLGYHATNMVLAVLMSNPDAPEVTQGGYRRLSFGTALFHESAYALAVAQWTKDLMSSSADGN